MPPKRKSSAGLDGSDAEGDVPVQEGESTAPRKRGRKSIIDNILQEEARGIPAPVLPQNQWSVSVVQPQELVPKTNTAKRRKVQPVAPPLSKPKYPSPGTPSIWAAGKGDFYSAFKSLTESFGGICFANIGAYPVLAWLVEGPRSAEDSLDGVTLHLSLMTEYQPKDQPGVTTFTAGPKKGVRKRRKKREDMDSVSTALDNAATTIIGTDPTPEGPKPAPQKQLPCLVRSSIYNPDYPTFCECLQPDCSHHSPIARELLLRSCTAHSWPPPWIAGLSDDSVQEGPAEGLNTDPVLPSHLPKGTVEVYAQVVPELESLLDHKERGDSMLVISSTDASMGSVLPFELPPTYGCIVLGFFNVESVECVSESHHSAPSIQPGKLSWKVRLRYAPPSDATDANGNLAPPWWLLPPAPLTASDVAAPSLSLPVPERENSSVEGEVGESGEAPMSVDARWCIVQALDGSRKRPWWHCLGCGKINQRVMLVHRRCSSCQRNEDTAPPFVIEDVLQDTSTVPYPFNHTPRSMKPEDISVKEFPDLTNVYCYSYEEPPLERAYVKHIFTGPYEDLKTQATGLFYLIQEGVELKWQHLSVGVAEGPYYSWRSPAGGLADSEVPQCIHQARKLIYRSVTNYGDKDPGDEFDLDEMMCDELPVDPLPSSSSYNPSKDDNEIAWKNGINSFVVLAWTASGTKKGTFISAQEHPVYVLCLGAPVELDLEQCLPISPEHAATVDAESNPAVNQDVVIQDVPVPEPEAEEAGQIPKGKKPRKSKKNPVTETGQETGANLKGTKKGKEKTTVHQPKPKPAVPPHERLKINMVHGDVLILSGEFIYTLTRSGMSILIFGMHDL